MQNLANSFLDEATLKKKREKASLSQIVISFATLVDKIQLLSGGVTSRTEQVKMTSKTEILDLLTDGKLKNTKMLEKSISFESAKNKLKDEKIAEKKEVTKDLIKNLLKNQCELSN